MANKLKIVAKNGRRKFLDSGILSDSVLTYIFNLTRQFDFTVQSRRPGCLNVVWDLRATIRRRINWKHDALKSLQASIEVLPVGFGTLREELRALHERIDKTSLR